MSKMAAIFAVLLCVAVAVSGCSRTQQTYTTPNGKVTTTKTGPNSGKVEFQGKEGKVTVETNQGQTVTEAQLGVPIYPGAKVDNTGKAEGKGQTVETTNLSTPDSYDKVCAFYKSNLNNVTNRFSNATGDMQTTTFVTGSMESLKTVGVSRGKSLDKTLISVVKVLK